MRKQFEEWQSCNPTKTFKHFRAEIIESKKFWKKKRKSLGGNLADGLFGEVGAEFFREIVGYGLKRENTCVDYGCGTLRIGIHAINYLEPSRYWGLDITEVLLDEGRRLIGEELLAEKRPNLRVISPESVAEASACKPRMLFSVKVLKCVHPADLPEYFENIVKIIGVSGRAIIQGRWSDDETIHYADRKWAHGLAGMCELVSSMGCKIAILKEEGWSPEGQDRILKLGLFCITHGTTLG